MLLLQCLLFFIAAILINSIHDKTVDIDLEIDPDDLEKDLPTLLPPDPTDLFQLNVGGEIIITTRQTLTKIPQSTLAILFDDQWEDWLSKDRNGNIFFDFNPIVFRHLLNQLQIITTNNSTQLYPPSQPSLIEPFNKMITKLGLQQSSLSEQRNIITFNVGGQKITGQCAIFTRVSNSTFDTIASPTKMMKLNNESDVFVDYHPKLFQDLIDQLRNNPFQNISYPKLSLHEEKISFKRMLIDLSIYQQMGSLPISINTKWKQHGVTVAGGNGIGNHLDQLYYPYGIFIDENRTIYIADTLNHRIVEWKKNANNGRIAAGGKGEGNQTDQLYWPWKVIVDKLNDSLIICDGRNRRVVRWPRRSGQSGDILISGIYCSDLKMDDDGYLYVSDEEKDEVRRWKIGEKNGTLVAGGNRRGNRTDQLNEPSNIFIDEDQSVYVSDWGNHRVMKWVKGAKQGIVVAGDQGQGNSLRKLDRPYGIIVDQLGSVYVADGLNHRVMRWLKGAAEGSIVVGGNGKGQQPNQLNYPIDLSFDQENNLYVVDKYNNRVQKFDINN